MENVYSSGKLFHPVTQISASGVYPACIKHEACCSRIKSFIQIIHKSLCAVYSEEFKVVIVVCELEAVFCVSFSRLVEVIYKLLECVSRASRFSGHTADTDIGCSPHLMYSHGFFGVVENFVIIVMCSYEVYAVLVSKLDKLIGCDICSRGMSLGISEISHFLKGKVGKFLILEKIS